MNVKFIILCRYNSSRLPGKILKEIQGEPILGILIKRLKYIINIDDIVVATSVNATDDPIAQYCEDNKIQVYRGALENVSERFLSCALKFNADYAVRINGDNLFADPFLIMELVNIAIKEKLQFVSNVPNRTYPTGMSVEVIQVSFYQRIAPDIYKDILYTEHVTLFLYNNIKSLSKYKFIENSEMPIAKGMHLAIDTIGDFGLASRIINELKSDFYSANWKRIVQTKMIYEKMEG